MSDDKKREELKAQINEKLDQLSVDELEMISGGITSANDGMTWTCPGCGEKFAVSDIENHLKSSHPELADRLEALLKMIQQLNQQSSETEKSIV